MSGKLLLFGMHQGVIPPLGLGYIASYLRKYLSYDNIVIELSETASFEDIKKHNPEIIGFTCVTRDYNKIVKLAERAKRELGIYTILGGHHITPIPHTLPKVFDLGVLGEGEQTMLELMKLFLEDKKFQSQKLEKIRGIAFHHNGNVEITSSREPIKPLDNVPYPARDLIDMEKFLQPTYNWSFFKPERITSMVSSRGCPYKCVYCSSAVFWKKYRYHSAEYVVGEIEFILNKYSVDGIMIVDDLFIGNKRRLREIVRLVKEKEIEKKVRFWTTARANLLDGEVCSLLKEMNVFHMGIGFESNSEHVLGFLKKSTVTVEENERVVLLGKKYGIDVEGGIIVGSPGETREDMMKTYEFLKRSPIDSFGVQVMTPLPGTEIWEMAKKRGLVSDTMDFDTLYDFNPMNYVENYDKYKHFLMTEEVSKSEFLRIYRKFQALQLKKGRYIKFHMRDLFSCTFWGAFFTDPRIALRVFRYFFGAWFFDYPRLWKFLRAVKQRIKKHRRSK